MVWKSYRKESREIDWGADQEGKPTIEQINCGCMLRIADAAEKMSGNYTAMQNEVEHLKRVREDLRQGIAHLEHSNAALRGHIKRLKKRR